MFGLRKGFGMFRTTQQSQYHPTPQYCLDFVEETLKDIKDPVLEAVINGVYNIYRDRFFVWKGGKSEHHSEKHGLLRHTSGVLAVSIAIANVYDKLQGLIDREALIAGAILHDLGKCDELTENGEYVHKWFKDQRGRWCLPINHSQIVLKTIDNVCVSLGIDASKSPRLLKVLNIVASHHYKESPFGTGEETRCIEASIVSAADTADSGIDANTINSINWITA